jgi:hypothetical protein
MLLLVVVSRSINIGAVRPHGYHSLPLQKVFASTKRCVTGSSEAYVREIITSTRLKTHRNPSCSFSSVVGEKEKDSFWNNPNIKGIDRSVKSDTTKGDRTFFGYKLEDSSIPLGQRSAPRSLPTRHSVHGFPGPICPPHRLEQAANEILQSDLGSLYAFNTQRIEEGDHILIIQDQLETVLRGFSACIEGSYLHRLLFQTHAQQHLDLDPLKVASVSTQFAPKSDLLRIQQHLTTMRRLLERLEREAEMYWKDKHSKVKNTTLDEHQETESIQSEEEKETGSSAVLGAAPGPTTTMYDLVLDANAIYASCIPLEDDDAKIIAMNTSRALFQKILARHEADGGPANVHPSTIPSPRSFHTLIQTAAMLPYDSNSSGEMVRDEAIDLAFITFDRMYRNDAVNRTWTTYENLLQVVFKFIPTSRSKGNIAYALFLQACEEGVVNEAVWEKLKSFGGLGNGPDFERYLQENSQKTWNQLPRKWRRYANTPNYGSKLRRSYNDGSFYDG